MTRPLRIEIPDGTYHITARGNAKQTIFRDAVDRRIFLATFERVLGRFAWRCLTYCLMDNHYHLVVITPRPNLARGMCQLNSSYATSFNRRHDRCGHVLQGRYSSVLVDRDEHLLHLVRYVAVNPVEAGFCRHPEAWPWSGHRALLGLCPPRFVAAGELLSFFGANLVDARARYRDFVCSTHPSAVPDGQAVLGCPDFVAASLELVPRSPEIPRRQWHLTRPPLTSVLAEPDRDRAIASAYRDYGYRMREIADALGCHYATVSRRLRAFESRPRRKGVG